MTRRPPRKRELSEDEQRLWEQAMRETTALHSRKRGAAIPAKRDEASPERRVEKPPEPEDAGPSRTDALQRRRPAQQGSRTRFETGSPATIPLARREARRIARDPESIDARLDLHGMRQREAYPALKAFVRASQARGHRLVLVITGKGGTGEAGQSRYDAWEATPFYEAPRGVLRRLVPEWLAKPEFRDVVASVSPAHARHGGDGALYVRLRRRAAPTASAPGEGR